VTGLAAFLAVALLADMLVLRRRLRVLLHPVVRVGHDYTVALVAERLLMAEITGGALDMAHHPVLA
jgi:hypothetical protein